MVIHVAVAALLVLEQQGGVVDGRELDEPMVEVGEVAPLDLRGGELRIENAGSCAAAADVRRRLERGAVVVGSVDDALRLRKLEDHIVRCVVRGHVLKALLTRLIQNGFTSEVKVGEVRKTSFFQLLVHFYSDL